MTLASFATLVSSPEHEPSERVTGSSYRRKLLDIDIEDPSGDVLEGLQDFWALRAVRDSAPPSFTFKPLSVTSIQWKADSRLASFE